MIRGLHLSGPRSRQSTARNLPDQKGLCGIILNLGGDGEGFFGNWRSGQNDQALTVLRKDSLRAVSRSIRSSRTRKPIPGPSGTVMRPSFETVTSGSMTSSAQ